jgi:hypothetical protein
MINGYECWYFWGPIGQNVSKNISLNEFGDCLGVCLHYQTIDEIAEEKAIAIL